MRLVSTALVFLSLAVTGAAEEGIDFDWPDPSQKLNLSAPLSLDYKYSEDELFDDIPELDVIFYYKLNYTDFGEWIEEVIMNHKLSGGRGTVKWDPSELLESVQQEGQFLAPGKVHYFEVTRHETGGGFGMTMGSPHYAVEAAEGVDSAGSVMRRVGGLLPLGIFAAVASVV